MKSNNLDSEFFLKALDKNGAALVVRAEILVRGMFPDQAVVAVSELDVERFAELEHCQLEAIEQPRPVVKRRWGGEDFDQLYLAYDQVIWEAQWQGNQVQVVHLEWETGCGGDSCDWVAAESVEIAEAFVLEVHRKTHAPGNAILVFRDGRWQRSKALYEATQTASFEDLVLANNLKQTIRDDFASFLGAEDRYTSLGISWRRGAILIGPPGNGKTHCVRALVKEMGIASLYVQSTSHPYYTEEQMWQEIFSRARGLTPCVLVLEDLDALVTDDNRSFFLNQLDGFEHNHGLIVLATTNYPERIDSAIMDRPSRFDRKYHFSLPCEDQRNQYLCSWQGKLAEETGWREDQVDRIVGLTDGFSFAYLKELVISSVTSWIDTSGSFANVMHTQGELLRSQMTTHSASTRNIGNLVDKLPLARRWLVERES